MSDTQFDSPEIAAQVLAKNSGFLQPAPDSSAQAVCLGPSDNGYFVLSWSANNIGTHDWIGLYVNASDPDDRYVKGDNWQWASKPNSYTTDTAVQPGYQARYLVWDRSGESYKSVARTPAYPARVCSG